MWSYFKLIGLTITFSRLIIVFFSILLSKKASAYGFLHRFGYLFITHCLFSIKQSKHNLEKVRIAKRSIYNVSSDMYSIYCLSSHRVCMKKNMISSRFKINYILGREKFYTQTHCGYARNYILIVTPIELLLSCWQKKVSL